MEEGKLFHCLSERETRFRRTRSCDKMKMEKRRVKRTSDNTIKTTKSQHKTHLVAVP